MKNVVLSADGDRMVYSVPDAVADQLEDYCMEFCCHWPPADPLCREFAMEKVSMKDSLPEVLQQDIKEETLQLLPGVHETDGFFMAKFRKK